MARLGLAALACYAVHAGYHLARGHPEDLLWACHLGAALIGVGILARAATLNGIGLLFVAFGTPLWLLYLSSGGEFLPTSLLTHVGGLVIGLFGVRRLGMPAGVWWRAVTALAGLILLCRLITPAQANVNVAFAVPSAWQKSFSSHPAYLATMMAVSAAYFFAVEYVLRHWLAPSPVRAADPAPAAQQVGA